MSASVSQGRRRLRPLDAAVWRPEGRASPASRSAQAYPIEGARCEHRQRRAGRRVKGARDAHRVLAQGRRAAFAHR
eukprot:scaffold100641_cov31-Tisochrysis_lutea.AAC.4